MFILSLEFLTTIFTFHKSKNRMIPFFELTHLPNDGVFF